MISATVVGVVVGLPLALLHWLRHRRLPIPPAFTLVFVRYWSIIFTEWVILTVVFAVR